MKKGSGEDNLQGYYSGKRTLHGGRNNVGKHRGIGSELDTIKNNMNKKIMIKPDGVFKFKQ